MMVKYVSMTNCMLYTEDKKVDSSPERETAVTAVTAGGVVGALLFIIGIVFLVILLPAVEIQTVSSCNTYK